MTTSTIERVDAPPQAATVTVGDLKAGGFTAAKRDFKNHADVLEILNFIDFLAQNNSTSADDLALPYEKGKAGQEWKLSRAEATKLFFGHIESKVEAIKKDIKLPDEAAQKAISDAFTARAKTSLNAMKANVERLITAAETHANNVKANLAAAKKAQDDMEAIRGGDHSARIAELCSRLAETNWNFHRFNNGILEFVSRTDIILRFIDDRAGLRYELNCGKFKAVFSVGEMQVTVVSHERTASRGPGIDRNNIHPHIDRSGSVCFGNGSDAYNRAVMAGDFVATLKLLDNMLPYYNSESPYINIAAFKLLLDQRDQREKEEHAKKEQARAAGIPEGLEDQDVLDDDFSLNDDFEWELGAEGESNE